MQHTKNLVFAFIILTLLAVPGLFIARPAAAEPVYTCLPTCEETDSRMLSLAGSGLNTLADQALQFNFIAAPDAAALEIGVFDGDTSGLWDLNTTPLEFTLYADPLANGDESVLVGQWLGNAMPDNAWYTINVDLLNDPNAQAAQAPSGSYFFHMVVRSTVQPSPLGLASNFKVRTDGVVSLTPQAFAFSAAMFSLNDLYVIYPGFPNDLVTTTYNGDFDFHVSVMNSVDHFAVWDGDLDLGSYTLAPGTQDSDDPNTPNDVLPGWAGPSSAYEGVAVGDNGTTGSPSDDSQGSLLRRSPSVYYEVYPLGQNPYLNSNPSGNREWEQFRIDSTSADPGVADYSVDSRLPGGLYHIHLRGMDVHNLNAWRFAYAVLGVCAADPISGEANPCKELPRPYLIGDTLFSDLDGDGVQNNGEAGIPGVEVCLYDGYGAPILDIDNNPICQATDANGQYFFDVEAQSYDAYTGDLVEEGVYTVRVTPSNFDGGGPLSGGVVSSTGGEAQTRTVIDANVLDADFGYTCPSAVQSSNLRMTALAATSSFKTATVSYEAATESAAPLTCPTFTNPGTGTIGYWQNHPEAWPVETITIGGVVYSKSQAIGWMKTASRGDKTIDLFKQLVAARLNVLIGNDPSCISAEMQAADDWLAAHPLGSGVKARSAEWLAISGAFTALDNYNNGLLCAPHRG